MMTSADIPEGLAAQARWGEPWVRWLRGLPGRSSDVLREWNLRRDGDEVWHGFESLLIPVRDDRGVARVMKVAFDGGPEGRDEALALQVWAGEGAVELVRADPRRRAVLMERVERRDLTSLDDIDACRIVAKLYRQLHVEASPRFGSLREQVSRWIDDLEALPSAAPIPRRMVQQAISQGRELASDDATDGTLIHGDLHYENVLARGGSWVVIDPKPLSGDPHYEPAPMLWNRLGAAAPGQSVREVIRRRFFTLVDEAGLDDRRARAWVVFRMVCNVAWAHADAAPAGRAPDAEEEDWITTCVTVAKAVMD